MIIRGVVKTNLGRGAKLGYPTANIDVDDLDQNIPDGLFVGLTEVDGKKWPSIVFIGISQTFNDTDRWLETHLLDFSGNLYGKELSVELLDKLRDNKKFETEQKLVEQMEKDEEAARKYFSTRGPIL